MKALLKRMAAMSIVLVLLCTVVVAQNEKSTKSVTSDYSGVTVSKNYVPLVSNKTDVVVVTVELGYKSPTLFYEGESFEFNDEKIFGTCFTAEIKNKTNGGCEIHITANSVKETDSDMFYVKAMVDYSPNNMNRSSTLYYGEPIVVTVYPKNKN